jgi:Fanconi anemia group M protein
VSEPVRIVVDTAEQRSAVYRVLAEMPELTVEVARLPVADYLLGGDLAVERKTADDFAASIADGRLFAQVTALKAAYGRPVILLEGTLSAARTRMHPNALRGALSYLVAIEGLAVVPAADAGESALLLAQLARHVQHGLRRPPEPTRKRGADGMAERQERLIAALPAVGPTLARVLLAHFGSAGAVLAADEAALQIVPGIGPVRAAAIRRTLATPFNATAASIPADRTGVGWLVTEPRGDEAGTGGDGGGPSPRRGKPSL